MQVIHGIAVDSYGRCAHYHSENDVVANKCATCTTWWACYQCHDQVSDHSFGRMPLSETAVLCGICHTVMDYYTYSARSSCPGCRHSFNSGCALHAHVYFQLDR
ncbi:CHY zinc finger protein [Corynebacterium kutscheri]|uniref:CHY zinc finger protein n=1 Tax=Corynebacterium kutscheri TaxID=35755 RepID=UPI000A01F746|nr:CHY zinc finger protein [Corynebacterium kutscheri]